MAYPFIRPHHIRRPRRTTGHFQRAYLFGGRKIGRHKGHVRGLSRTGKPLRRRIEGGKVMGDVKRRRAERRRFEFSRLPGEFVGSNRDPRRTTPRTRRIEGLP